MEVGIEYRLTAKGLALSWWFEPCRKSKCEKVVGAALEMKGALSSARKIVNAETGGKSAACTATNVLSYDEAHRNKRTIKNPATPPKALCGCGTRDSALRDCISGRSYDGASRSCLQKFSALVAILTQVRRPPEVCDTCKTLSWTICWYKKNQSCRPSRTCCL